MNNWRLLLLAVVAVLQPNRSYTESNLIDGHQGCYDHRSSSITQETRLCGKSRKNTLENRRLNSQDIREDRRRSETRNGPIRFRETLTVDRTDIRFIPESVPKFNTETRFARDQNRRQRSDETKDSRITRNQSRRIRESISRDSLSRYERDALDSRRIRMSRDDTRIGRVSNERVFGESSGFQETRRVREFEDFRRVSVDRDSKVVGQGKDDVAHDESRRDSRIGMSRRENRLEYDNNRERRNLDNRVRKNRDENRRSRSLESRVTGVERDNHRSIVRPITEQVDERRRDQNRESRARTAATLRDSTERIIADRKLESRDAVHRVDESRRNIREYRTGERIEVQQQQRDESNRSRERSTERRDTRLNTERRQSLSRESRILDANVRSERTVMTDNRNDARREATRVILRTTRDSTNERGLNSRARILDSTTSALRTDETRDERRQPSTRSFERVRSDEREFTARTPERNGRDERAVRHRRNVRSEERLDGRREQRYRSRMPRERQILLESKDSAERRQKTRSTISPSRFEVNGRTERESRLRERDNVGSQVNRREREERRASREQTRNQMARDTEHRYDGQLSRFANRINSEDRDETRGVRLDVYRDAHDENRIRTVVSQRLTREVFAPRRFDSRRISRVRSDDIRDERQQVRERYESRASRDRVSMTRLSEERIERREARETTRDSRVDARNDIIKIRMTRVESSLQLDGTRSEDRVLQRQTRHNLAARSVKRRFRENGSQNVEIRSERLIRSGDVRRTNGDIRNEARVFRVVASESKRMTEREMQPKRHNSAIEHVNLMANRASRAVRIEAKLRSSDIFLSKDIRADTRRDTRDTLLRSFEAKVHDIDAENISDNENAMSWQMVIYTLQGAYLCGFLMQMLTEKSNKKKSGSITAWWTSASKNLVQVD